MNNEKIGNNIKKWRKLKKLTQQELGEKIDKTLSSIQKYEKGNVMIPIDVLSNIAKALNIGIDKLIYENGGCSNKIENNKYDTIIIFTGLWNWTIPIVYWRGQLGRCFNTEKREKRVAIKYGRYKCFI